MSKLMFRPIEDIKKLYQDLFTIYPYRISLVADMYVKGNNSEYQYMYQEFGTAGYMKTNFYISIMSMYKSASGFYDEFRVDNKCYWEFLFALESATKWFINNDNNIFAQMDDGSYKVVYSVKPIEIRGVFDDMKLELLPATINNDKMCDIGVGMYVNSSSDMIFIPARLLMNIYTFFKNYNINIAGMMLVNYLGRPDSNTNNATISQEQNKQYVPKQSFLTKVGVRKRNQDE